MTLLRKTITTNPGNSIYTDTFEYNSNNQLTKIIYSADIYSWTSVADIKYDADNRVKTLTYNTVYENENRTEKESSYSYYYDNDKMVKKVTTWGNADTVSVNDTYGYDAQGRLIVDTTFSGNTSKIYSISQYTWNENNDVSQCDYYLAAPDGKISLVSLWNYVYDSGKNAYANLGLPIYCLDEFIGANFGANNMIQYLPGGQLAETTINEYDDKGLLMKSTSQVFPNTLRPTTMEYFYQ